MNNPNRPKFYTYAEAGDWLSASGRTVRRLVATGELPALKVNARVVRIAETDLAAYVARIAALGRKS